jgi:hypothetical protein
MTKVPQAVLTEPTMKVAAAAKARQQTTDLKGAQRTTLSSTVAAASTNLRKYV